jgi:hypothetical protein
LKLVISDIADWCNQNSGFLTAIIFVVTLIIGWISGFFKLIRKRPKFKIRTIEGATFYSTIYLDKTYEGHPVHKTAFVLYIEITNTGNAPSSIGQIKIGYLPDNKTPIWRAKRNWIYETILKSQLISKFKDSELVKGYPFLKQKSDMYSDATDTFLDIGKIANGIAYFEERETFGNWTPRLNKDKESTNVKIEIKDAFGQNHTQKIKIKRVEPSKALEMSPYFGQTYVEYFIAKNETTTIEE